MLIHQQRDEFGRLCEVRRAGNVIRLYTDGIFHSQYHPHKLQEGSLWDMLWLPSLLCRPAPRRILVLGVGGGAVMRKLAQLYPEALIIGVDISGMHLSIARRFFGVRGKNTQLCEADALAFVRHYRGPGFDLVVDDLFAGTAQNPQRVVSLDEPWQSRLKALMEPGAALVANFASTREFNAANRAVSWPAILRLNHRQYDNVVGGFFPSKGDVSARRLKARLAESGGGSLQAAVSVRVVTPAAR